MQPNHRKPRRVSTTLVREATDWGLSVSETRVRSSWLNVVLLVLSSFALFCGMVFALPLLVGLFLSAEITWLGVQILIVGGLIGLALMLSIQSRKGPRNALELDEKASQLRLGFKNRYGAFVRQRVIPLKLVEDAIVVDDTEGKPELNIVLNGEQVRIALIDAKAERLHDIATQICDAATAARSSERRSRIGSSIAGIGASYREMTNRVVSRVIR